MIYRALVSGLDLTCLAPKLDLSQSILSLSSEFDFCAMTPLQVETTLDQSPEAISKIGSLIIGGAPISAALQERIALLDTMCFATYGMTETITHVAMRALNHPAPEQHYTAIEGVRFETEDGLSLIHI